MDAKTFWVALPLVVFAAWVVLRRAFARPLTRHALNVQQAVLLLAYFAVTSGLGIFWVANQQLPVFDLHYLFGYATVLLVAAHVLINWRLVWGYFTKPRPAKRAGAEAVAAREAAPAAAGRWKWGLTVWLATVLLAFGLGMRYGGSELTATWNAGGPAPAAAAPVADDAPRAPTGGGPIGVVEEYHAMSSHDRVGVILRAPGVDWGAPPAPFKTYPDAPIVALPPPLREAPASPARLDLRALSTILFYSFGVTERSGGFDLRASPSSGALFPTELYVAAREIEGLARGVYHYDPRHHRLHRLRDAAPTASQLGATDRSIEAAPAVLVATSIFRRTGYKYRDRAYRYAAADAGHALENVRAASDVMGYEVTPLRQFDESRAAEAVGVDGVEEGVLALLVLDAKRPAWTREQFTWPAAPRQDAGPLGVTSLVHLATSLRLHEFPAGTAGTPATRQAAAELPAGAIALPVPTRAEAPVLETIGRRRSVRRFERTPMTRRELASLLHFAAGAAAPTPLSDAVRVHVICHGVEGVTPGAYRYDAASHALVPGNLPTRGDLRAASASAALAQDVIGDAAVVVILSLDRQKLFEGDGARGYRHGFLEAGMIGERIYLEAGARGLGACAVGAFYDAEAAALIGVEPAKEWVLHFAAIGVPAQ